MAWPPEQLKEIAERAKTGAIERHTMRELLAWYQYERRGSFILYRMQRHFEELGLKVEPSVESVYIDGYLTFSAASEETAKEVEKHPPVEEAQAVLITSDPEDPTQRIGRLPSANNRPVSVNPSATIAEAITLMMLHDFSQLPVMQGERSLKGAITWQSIGRRLALHRTCNVVQDCIEDALVLDSNASLFSAISTVVERGFVLVRDDSNVISGIVTTADLSLQFRQLAEPFLLLGEIEKHLRGLSDGKFTAEELASAKDPNDAARTVTNLADMTFGEHIRLLEEPSRWAALGVRIDRATFVKLLNEVRDIRNGVMHFDPDGTAPSELETLRQFVRLLTSLRN